MESKTIKIGEREFKSKKSLQELCKRILNSTQVGNKLEGEYFDIMDFVFKMHPEYFSKIKGMTYTIHKRPAVINKKNNEFYIKRADGSEVDFSYLKCFKKTQDSDMATIKKHLKWTIREQMQYHKKEKYERIKIISGGQYGIRCESSGEFITWDQIHLDHHPVPFDNIMNEWLDKTGYGERELALDKDPEATYSYSFKDKNIEREWQEYHYTRATYMLIKDKINLSKGKKVVETETSLTQEQLYCKSLLGGLFKKYEG